MILFVDGIPDNNLIRFSLDKKGIRRLMLSGITNAFPYLGIKENQRLIHTLVGQDFQQPDITLPQMPRLIFNQIADPDTSFGALERCVELVKHTGAPVINHPTRVLQTMRHQVAETLQGIDGLRVPRTIRCEPLSPEDVYSMASAANIELPFIVRVAGEHGGQQMLRVDSDDAYADLHAFPFDGRAFYILEYLEFADKDGVYHKYRIAMIGQQAIARHALVGSEWKVHSHARDSDYYRAFPPEQERVARIEHEFLPHLARVFTEIRERLGLDYFGVDCSISDAGEVTLFEANAAMNLLQNLVPGLDPVIDRIRTATRDLIARRSGMSLA